MRFACWFRVAPKRCFGTRLDSLWTERTRKVRDGEDAIADTRALTPERRYSTASDGAGLLRYVQSRVCLLEEFISCNTASTAARLGENSQTGSVFAAYPLSNAA